MSRKRQPWGSVRALPSGRFQARYRVDGAVRAAPRTFATKREADAFLAETRGALDRGSWIDPNAGKVSLRDYATRWLIERTQLRPRTRELYEGLLRLHILPGLGDTELVKLTPTAIRTWHSELIRASKPRASTPSKAYRLLRTILNTAVVDELLTRNPCLITGAGTERPDERPVATIEQVYDLANAIEPAFRAMVLFATFTGLRLGELRALRRSNLDLLHATVRVVEQMQELADGELLVGPPKTDAGHRIVAIPKVLIPELEAHLSTFSGSGPDGLVFPGTKQQPLRRATLYTAWNAARRSVGLPGFRFHDLRHTGNTLAAAAGASTKELMVRMGHASARAALIYQHAVRERDVAIAGALSDAIERVLGNREPVRLQVEPTSLALRRSRPRSQSRTGSR
ncbi:MAG: site-specific integrase [Acidimicrobiia bacterium]